MSIACIKTQDLIETNKKEDEPYDKTTKEKTNSATEKEDNTIFVPNILRKNHTENESIIVPSILPTKTQKAQLETLPDDILLDSRRRSNRLKKPPDKLQM